MNHQKQLSNTANKTNGYMNEYYSNQQAQAGQPGQQGHPQQPGQPGQQPTNQSPATNQSNPVLPPPLTYYSNQQPTPQQAASQPASNQPPSSTSNTNSAIASKFTNQDIQILRQLLIAGEKHKWKQITKEINQLSPNNAMHYRNHLTGSRDSTGNQHSPQQAAAQNSEGVSGGSSAAKNVSPTFVIKQYQSLLGLPNNALYFGSLGSSLPYVVANNGWDDLNYEYQGHFGDIE